MRPHGPSKGLENDLPGRGGQIRTRACAGTQRSGRCRGYSDVQTHDDSEVWARAVGAASVALPARYRPRSPEATVLHRTVRANLEPFLADARERSEHGFGLPRFVEEEFRSFIDCGVISRGFMRVRCRGCGDERQCAREEGVDVSVKGGAVTFVQRFNSALGLNIHSQVLGSLVPRATRTPAG